ncbi:MAG TPA: hypothetical protein PKD54_04805, partial [Pirellulaceae bacterium]|nr:hypothetical protein [Pirellulaceae bacterium]
ADDNGERETSSAIASSGSGLHLHVATTAGKSDLSSGKIQSAASIPFREPPASISQTRQSYHPDEDIATAITPVQEMVNKTAS